MSSTMRLRRACEAAAVEIDLAKADTGERAPVGKVLQSRERRLRHQIQRRSRHADRASSKQDRAQHIDVVAVLVAAGNHEHPRPRHIAIAMPTRLPSRSSRMCRLTPWRDRAFFDLAQDDTPPFDDRRPASNVAVIVFPLTGDRPGRNDVVSVMVSGAFLLVAYDHVSTTKSYVSRRVSSPLTSPNSCRHE